MPRESFIKVVMHVLSEYHYTSTEVHLPLHEEGRASSHVAPLWATPRARLPDPPHLPNVDAVSRPCMRRRAATMPLPTIL